MANFDFVTKVHGPGKLSFRIATVAHGNMDFHLDGNPLTEDEAAKTQARMANMEWPEGTTPERKAQETEATIQVDANMRRVHGEIILIVDKEGPDGLVNSIGTDPLGWFEPFCNAHKIPLS